MLETQCSLTVRVRKARCGILRHQEKIEYSFRLLRSFPFEAISSLSCEDVIQRFWLSSSLTGTLSTTVTTHGLDCQAVSVAASYSLAPQAGIDLRPADWIRDMMPTQSAPSIRPSISPTVASGEGLPGSEQTACNRLRQQVLNSNQGVTPIPWQLRITSLLTEWKIDQMLFVSSRKQRRHWLHC